MQDRPIDYSTLVRQNHPKTTAYLLADTPPCTKIRDDEINRINRSLVPVSTQDLPDLEPAGSWMLAAVVCPGDDLTRLASWVSGLPVGDHDRIRLYAHPKTDLFEALKPWYAAGLDDPYVHIVTDWKNLHPPFGRDLNDRVYKDFKGEGL